MPTTAISTREDAQIRECMDALTQALRAKDIRALMAHYAPEGARRLRRVVEASVLPTCVRCSPR